jgi:membrane protein YdbS with pleckstrin-like domain
MPTTIESHPLKKNKIVKRFLLAAISWAFLIILVEAVVVSFLGLRQASVAASLVAAFAVLAAWQYYYEVRYFDAYFYNAQADFLVIRKGWIAPNETVLNYENIREVHLCRDALDRMLGLVGVRITTVTEAPGTEPHIDGLDAENAEAIREAIMENVRRVKKKK